MTARQAAALGFAVGFAASWFVLAVVPLPLVWYLPLERSFTVATTVTTLGMDYYGRLLASTLGGGLCALLGAALPGRASARSWLFGTIWIGGLVAMTFALEVALLAHRVPVPLLAP